MKTLPPPTLGSLPPSPQVGACNKATITMVTYHILTTILLVTSDYIFKILEEWKWCLMVTIAVEKPRQENKACFTCRIYDHNGMPIFTVSHQN